MKSSNQPSGPRSPVKWKIRMYLSYTGSFLEIFLAVLLAIALAICSVQLIPEVFNLKVSVHDIHIFRRFLEALFVLVIGVEALKLLCKHTPGSALEIILFTIAREMIVEHTTPEQNVLVVLSIAILFAIRRFLYVPAWGSENDVAAFDQVVTRYREYKRKKGISAGQHVKFRQDSSQTQPKAGAEEEE